MGISVLTGTIKRRLLVNFRCSPEAVARILPSPLRPKLHEGYAMAGICLIRLKHERPSGVPAALGLASENAAHRFAVEWSEADGTVREGVFVAHRHTDSALNRLAGGRMFPVHSEAARFCVSESGGRIELAMRSRDGSLSVSVEGSEAESLPAGSCFSSLPEASAFFEAGSLGYSRVGGQGLQGIRLWTPEWRAGALAVSRVSSSYFEDSARFPAGSIEFDHALVMRDVRHEWRDAARLGDGSS